MRSKLLIVLAVLALLAAPASVEALLLMADFGDAPDPPYPTLYGSSGTPYPGRIGPFHFDVTQEWIGPTSAQTTTTVESNALTPDLDYDDGAVALVRITHLGTPTGVALAYAQVSTSPCAMEELRFLNVAADLNKDGKFAAYTTAQGTQLEWLAQNVPLSLAGGATDIFATPWLVVDPSIPGATGIWVRATLTTEPIDPGIFGPAGWDGSGPSSGFARGETEDHRVGIGVEDITTFTFKPDFISGPPISTMTAAFVSSVIQTNGDKPKGPALRDDLEDRGQDAAEKGTCVPTQYTNSLRWLEKNNKDFNTGLTGDALFQALAKAFKPTWVPGTNYGGVPRDHVVADKKKFIEDKKWPIVTKEEKDTTKILDFIKKQFDAGEDVEIILFWADDSGHMLSVGGYSEEGGKTTLYVRDGITRNATGPTMESYEVGPNLELMKYIIPDGSTFPKISWAISESVVPKPPKKIKQVNPGSSGGTGHTYGGYDPRKPAEIIVATPGVLEIDPGENWSNFVRAAHMDPPIPYYIKSVVMIKEPGEVRGCSHQFHGKPVVQRGTAAIRLWWPTMFEPPGTKWTLSITYGTYTSVRLPGESAPSPNHQDVWKWEVVTDIPSIIRLVELFHQLPFRTSEVPLISDEDLVPVLLGKLREAKDALARCDKYTAVYALEEFQMLVSDACIPSAPTLPWPRGSGTGIADTPEYPACCKMLVDAEYAAMRLLQDP